MKWKTESERTISVELNNKIAAKEAEIAKLRSKPLNPKRAEKIDTLYRQINKLQRKARDYWTVCYDVELEPCVSEEMVEWYLSKVHPSNGYIAAMLNSTEAYKDISRRMMDTDAFKKKAPYILSMGFNSYISVCEHAHRVEKDGEVFKNGTQETALQTQAIVIDLDYRNTPYAGLLAEDLYETMREDGAFEKYGEPSFCVVSSEGSGIQLYYLLQQPYKTYLKAGNIKRYENVTRALIAHYEPYGADTLCGDIGHLFRLPCSYNTKTDSYGFLLHWERLKDDEIPAYTFEALEGSQEAPREPRKAPARKTPRPPAEADRASFTGIASGRCRDLETLIRLRHGDLEGLRNILLFIYAATLSIYCKDEEMVLEAVLKANNLLSSPLLEKEAKGLIQKVFKKTYNYKDETICELLDITDEEKKSLQVIGHGSSNSDKCRNYKNRRDREKRLSKIERDKKVLELQKKGWTINQIVNEIGISESTVHRIIAKGKVSP